MAVVTVDRARVLGYRVGAQGLDRAEARGRLAVLELGLQDTSGSSARLAAAARTGRVDWPGGGAPELAVAWTLRGAPHVHPAGELPRLAGALWPLSDTDALTRVGWQRARLADVGMGALEALGVVAEAMRKVITGTTAKGAASAAVTGAVPGSLSAWCRPCGSRHVLESVFRLAALPAGLRLEPELTPAHLTPIAGWPGIPARADGTAELVRAYLRFLGPAGPGEVAAFLTMTRGELRKVWPDDLVEVNLDGRAAWMVERDVAALAAAEPARLVRLLPPSDPYLQARDRALLLPDEAARKSLWTALGQPGAVLVDGELVGTWRPRAGGRTLRLSLDLWGELTPAQRKAVETEAGLVAAVRGAAAVDVRYT